MLDDGSTLPDLERAATTGYADCDAETRANAVARLRPQMPAPFVDPVPVAAWREIPATYVVCTEDQSLPVELQRSVFAPRAGEVVELASSHAPFFSQPDAGRRPARRTRLRALSYGPWSAVRSAASVFGPRMPSAVSLNARWKRVTAFCVAGP